MPAYKCGDCGEFFKSKKALGTHRENCKGPETETVYDDMHQYVSGISIDFSPRNLRSKFTLRNAGLAFGVLMMATLFLGTASFMTSTAPAQGSGPTGAVASETNPALGYSIRSARDVPTLSNAEQPQYVSSQPLGIDQQLWAITQGGKDRRPAAIIHYNCDTQCPELTSNLEQFANTYPGWVYVAPNPELSSRIAVTSFQNIQRYESFEPEKKQEFVCSTLQNQPLSCATG